jgi:ketol-acid reductoisomerase
MLVAHGFVFITARSSRAPTWMSMIALSAGPYRASTYGGGGVPMLTVHHDASKKARDVALSYAAAIGGAPPVIETNFREGAGTTLTGEQAVLCGGTVELVRPATRRWSGGLRTGDGLLRMPARTEVDRRPIYEGGIANMNIRSPTTPSTANMSTVPGSTPETKQAMKAMLTRIQTGEYAKDLSWKPPARHPFRAAASWPATIEVVGEKMRSMMPWIKRNKLVDQTRN